MSKLHIPKVSQIRTTAIQLPSSKSISNRALIINALAGGQSNIDNLSEARDTKTMLKLLNSQETELDVLDAGTTMRFLTAYLTSTNQQKVLTGTPRMQERPIKILVDALKQIGGEISYIKNEGYPPMRIDGLPTQKSSQIKISGDVSSQYISALLMIAPTLPEGLTLEITGKIGSRPYIEMTLAMMKHFGVTSSWEDNRITIAPQSYTSVPFDVEPDWSGASYWYSWVSLSECDELFLTRLKDQSLQGDRRMADIMEKLGVHSDFREDGVSLTKIESASSVEIDFSDCPDLAQTVAVICAVKGIKCTMTGLESLRIKETDRIAALQNELAKIGARIDEKENLWELTPADDKDSPVVSPIDIHTYEDHRMAMAFAPLATLTDIIIDDSTVVQKSYPGYWSDLELAGIKVLSID
ncbi:MAG: 3-phosphoshikimate 1-carboxyvinyltransferase [Bacteroidota bacterium]